MTQKQLQDKCRGSLLGGAIGDALGYEVEFMSLPAIRKRFGETGIADYALHNGVAEFSDDTQMSLFTAEGLLNGTAAGRIGANHLLDSSAKASKTVLSQNGAQLPKQKNNWLLSVVSVSI